MYWIKNRWPGQRRRRRDEGAVAVEAAFIFPVLVLILFGIIEFSLILRDHVALSAAARAGARTATTLPRVASFGTDTAAAVARAGTTMPMSSVEELWVYEPQANGYPLGASSSDPFASCNTRCLRYTYSGGSFVTAGGSWSHTLVNACPGDPGMTSVGVFIKASHRFVTGILGTTMDLTDHAVLRFEPIPPNQLTSTDTCK